LDGLIPPGPPEMNFRAEKLQSTNVDEKNDPGWGQFSAAPGEARGEEDRKLPNNGNFLRQYTLRCS
jgi:hypothetical protein